MKNLILILLCILTPIFILTLTSQSTKNTEVIITIPNLNHKNLSYLLNEFEKHPDIEYIESSIASQTIVLKVDDFNFNQYEVENMLKKWKCYPDHFEYNVLANVDDIE